MKNFLSLAAAALMLGACAAPQQIAYFQNAAELDGASIPKAKEIVLRPKDKISIIVNCKSPELTNLFNLPYVTQRLGQNTTSGNTIAGAVSNGYVSGYTIGPDGTIDFPVIGKLNVGGMTRSQIEDLVKEELVNQGQAQDAVVTVEYMNLFYKVMGEVNAPGRFAIDKDATTIFDALSNARDLTIWGRRDNVRVVRDENGKQRTYFIDLCDARSIIESPAYYLQQGDVVYVEPNDMRARQSTVNGNNVRSTSFWISLASLAATLTLTIVNIADKAAD